MCFSNLLSNRIGCLITAYFGLLKTSFFLGLLQFVVAPYSFFSSAATFVEVGSALFLPHYITFFSLLHLWKAFSPGFSSSICYFEYFQLNKWVVISLLAADQAQ